MHAFLDFKSQFIMSCADILTQRRQAFASLAVILRQRDELLQIQVDTLSGLASPDLKEDDISLAHSRVGFSHLSHTHQSLSSYRVLQSVKSTDLEICIQKI